MPHLADHNDEHWFAIAKDAQSKRRLLARFQPREQKMSNPEMLFKLVGGAFATELSTLAVLALAAGVSLSALRSWQGGDGAAPAAVGQLLPPAPEEGLVLWAMKGIAFGAHGMAEKLEGRAAPRHSSAAAPLSTLERLLLPWSVLSLLERLLLLALCLAVVARAVSRLQYPRTRRYHLIIKPCGESEAIAALQLQSGRASLRAEGRSLLYEILLAFNHCLQPEGETELRVAPLLEAFQSLRRIGEAIGPLMALSVKNDDSNVAKVRKVWARLGERDGECVATVRGLLEAEKELGVHRPGAVLADPSAAMALLWMRRTMECVSTPSLGTPSRAPPPPHGYLLGHTFPPPRAGTTWV